MIFGRVWGGGQAQARCCLGLQGVGLIMSTHNNNNLSMQSSHQLPTRAKVAACSHNPECSLAHNLGTPTECLTAQHNFLERVGGEDG